MIGYQFKYADLMGVIEAPCPPADFKPRETNAFRWVFDTMDDERNFQPQYLKNPARFQSVPPAIQCQSIGLSFFSSEEFARVRFKVLTNRMLKAVKDKIGKNLAEGFIREQDGVSNFPDEKGHFTLHPSEEADFTKNFILTASL